MKNAVLNKIVKNKKALAITGGVVVTGVILLILLKKKGKSVDGSTVTEPNVSSSGIVSWPIKKKAGLLTNKAEQEVIKNIQTFLNTRIFLFGEPIEVDGYFGSETEARSQQLLGVKEIGYSLYKEIIGG